MAEETRALRLDFGKLPDQLLGVRATRACTALGRNDPGKARDSRVQLDTVIEKKLWLEVGEARPTAAPHGHLQGTGSSDCARRWPTFRG
jgi:hypothetical protein